MNDVEIFTMAGWLVLLVIGIWLMCSPVKQDYEVGELCSELIEPEVSEEILTMEIVESFRQIQKANVEQTLSGSVTTRVEHHQETNSPIQDCETAGAAFQSDDEVLYLKATEEVENDTKRPALWAKALALKEGDQEKAKYHYIRQRVEQMTRETPASNMPSGNSVGDNVSEHIDSIGVRRRTDATELLVEAENSELFDRGAINNAITKQTPLGKLAPSLKLLSDYFVRGYVTNGDICKKLAERPPIDHRASSFFDTYRHRCSVEVTDVLTNAEPEIAERYRETTPFPYEYMVDFFDEVLVVTLLPGSTQTEFLIISPISTSSEDFLASFVVSSSITDLFVAAAAENPLALYQELEFILKSWSVSGRDLFTAAIP